MSDDPNGIVQTAQNIRYVLDEAGLTYSSTDMAVTLGVAMSRQDRADLNAMMVVSAEYGRDVHDVAFDVMHDVSGFKLQHLESDTDFVPRCAGYAQKLAAMQAQPAVPFGGHDG